LIETSAPVRITVRNEVTDTTAPVVTLTLPAANTRVSGLVQLRAHAPITELLQAYRSVLMVWHLERKTRRGRTQPSLDSSTLPNGIHTITAVTRDTANRTATLPPVAIIVENAAQTQFALRPIAIVNPGREKPYQATSDRQQPHGTFDLWRHRWTAKLGVPAQ
jgi:hypothetical protein